MSTMLAPTEATHRELSERRPWKASGAISKIWLLLRSLKGKDKVNAPTHVVTVPSFSEGASPTLCSLQSIIKASLLFLSRTEMEVHISQYSSVLPRVHLAMQHLLPLCPYHIWTEGIALGLHRLFVHQAQHCSLWLKTLTSFVASYTTRRLQVG